LRPPEPWGGLRVADPQGACGEEPLLEHARAARQELQDPCQVRSSIERRLRLPLAEGQPAASAQVEGLLDVLLEATSSLDAPLTLATLNHWHQRLFAAGLDELRAIRIGELRGEAPMQVGFPPFFCSGCTDGQMVEING